MKELNERQLKFTEELKELLKKHSADISIRMDFTERNVIQIDFNRTDTEDYSCIQINWIDEKDIDIVE